VYVALRQLKVTRRDESGNVVRDKQGRDVVDTVFPGEEVPGVEFWKYPDIIAHLNLDWMKWDGAGIAPHNGHKGAVVDISAYRGKGPSKRDGAGAEGKPAQLPKKAPAAEIACRLCEKAFKSKGGLRKHVNKAHAEAEKTAESPKAG
jgi:hypothetical protein